MEDLPSLVSPERLVADSGGGLKVGDPRLESAAAGASAAVRRYCRWHVAPIIEETVVLDGSGGRVLKVPTMRLLDVLGLKLGGVAVPSEQFSWSDAGLLELHGQGPYRVFPRRFRSVEVTLVHGYSEAPDLVGIASQVARFALASPMGRTREQAGQLAVSWGTSVGMAWSDDTRQMMKTYRLQLQP